MNNLKQTSVKVKLNDNEEASTSGICEKTSKGVETIVNYIQIPAFLIYHGLSNNIAKSNFCEKYEHYLHIEKSKNILYLISLDLQKNYPEQFKKKKVQDKEENDDDDRFIEVKDLKVFIHDGVYTSIKYKVTLGRGYKLLRINYNTSDE